MGITIYVNCIYLLPRLATPLRVSFCSKKLEQTSRGEHFWPGRRLGMGQKSKLFRINIFGLERDGTSQLVQYSKINDPYIYINHLESSSQISPNWRTLSPSEGHQKRGYTIINVHIIMIYNN